MYIRVTRVHRTVEIEPEFSRGPEAAHLKVGVPIFHNLQQNQKSDERENFYDPRLSNLL